MLQVKWVGIGTKALRDIEFIAETNLQNSTKQMIGNYNFFFCFL